MHGAHLFSWIVWRQAVEFLEHDLTVLEQTDVRILEGYRQLLAFLLEAAKTMVQASAQDLRKHDIRVLGEIVDRQEYFVFWRHRGKTGLFRMQVRELVQHVQQKVDGLVEQFLSGV